MELVTPSEKYLDSYYKGCAETWGHVHDSYILHDPKEFEEWKTCIFKDYENQKNGINLPEGFVPSVTYWCIDRDKYIGTVNIRLELTKGLTEYGGNLGVVLTKSERGKNLGLEITKLALNKMAELNISPIVLTCEESNVRSLHILEHLPYKKREFYETILNGNLTKARRYFL